MAPVGLRGIISYKVATSTTEGGRYLDETTRNSRANIMNLTFVRSLPRLWGEVSPAIYDPAELA